jgi:hypothetical protein
MRLFFTIFINNNDYLYIKEVSFKPFKNCYFVDLKDDEVFKITNFTPLYRYNGKSTNYLYYDGIEIYSWTVEYHYGEKLKSSFSVSDLYENLERFLSWIDSEVITDGTFKNKEDLVLYITELKQVLINNKLPVKKEFFDKYINL